MSARPFVRWVCDRCAQESAPIALPPAQPGAPLPPPDVPKDWARVNVGPIVMGPLDLCPTCRTDLAHWIGQVDPSDLSEAAAAARSNLERAQGAA